MYGSGSTVHLLFLKKLQYLTLVSVLEHLSFEDLNRFWICIYCWWFASSVTVNVVTHHHYVTVKMYRMHAPST